MEKKTSSAKSRKFIREESRQISIGSGPAGKGRVGLRWWGPGRFGPSRKKEAAARRFGNYQLWVLNAGYDPDNVG
jgi:hypothetical protein